MTLKDDGNPRIEEESEVLENMILQYMGEDDALKEGLDNINGVNPVGKDIPKRELQQKAQEKKNQITTTPHLTNEEKTAAIKKVDTALSKVEGEVDKATDQVSVENAKTMA